MTSSERDNNIFLCGILRGIIRTSIKMNVVLAIGPLDAKENAKYGHQSLLEFLSKDSVCTAFELSDTPKARADYKTSSKNSVS